MTQYIRLVVVAATLYVVSMTAGCAAPTYIKPGFNVGTMDKIVVLPVMDSRSDPNPKHDFEQMKLVAHAAVGRAIRYVAGHRALLSTDIGQVGSYTADRLPRFDKIKGKLVLQGVDRDWVRNLGPQSCKWTAVPVLEGVSKYYAVFAAGGNATLSLYIFDRKNGDLVWFDSSISRVNETGILTPIVLAAALKEVELVEMAAITIAARLGKKKAPFLIPD